MAVSLLLQTNHLEKSFGAKKVLKNVSFVVSPGRVIGIEGENGSGKTTFLKILVGSLKADNGSCQRNVKMGYCPQEPELFNGLNVQENLSLFADAYGLYERAGTENCVQNLLTFFRFEQYRFISVAKLSGGTRQKLNLIIALLHEPALLILDEPYSAFDWESYVKFWEYIRSRKQKGVSSIIVSHLIYDTTQIDERYYLKDGVLGCASQT
ncbi:ABC transporter ATP-binding protein [candidate division KSB1 bacterium]|nr:ABC transporter ATP-binding protein [candidate division KSB1 bacterium]